MTWLRWTRGGAATAAFLTLLLSHAFAGMITPCTAPGMFPDSDVTVFVLPYVDYTSDETSQVESPVGTGLAGLIQADTLLAISRFGKVASIRLMGRPSECQPEVVQNSVIGEFGWQNRSRGIVIVWGRIFRVENEIYVQSYASFGRLTRYDPGEMLELPFGDRKIAAHLVSQTLTFAPHHVSEDDLKAIRKRFEEASIVHQKPDQNSPGKPLMVLFPEARHPAYYMTDSQGDWIRIHTQTGQDGWILARAMVGQKSLSERLPEMKFVEGLAGYFVVRNQSGETRAESAAAALQSFEESPLSATAPSALAVSKQLRGMLELLKGKQSDEAFARAAPLFSQAAEAAPSSSAASNMAAVVSLYQEWKKPDGKVNFQGNVNRFWSSISADPYDQTALTNCWTMFLVARSPDFRGRFVFDPPVSPDEMDRTLQELEAVQLKGSKVVLAHAVPVVAWPTP